MVKKWGCHNLVVSSCESTTNKTNDRLFKCLRLNKLIKVSPDAIPDKDYGWICDCGNWTELDKENHVVDDRSVKNVW